MIVRDDSAAYELIPESEVDGQIMAVNAADLWYPNSTMKFCNVPWDAQYKDVVRFASETARTAYFDSLLALTSGFTITKNTYLKPNEPLRASIPYNKVVGYNYVVVENPLNPVPNDQQRTYYYFVVGLEYKNPSVTNVLLQLDVWTTFQFDINFGRCFVDRGHIGIANANVPSTATVTGAALQRYLTQPEGLDIGNDYSVVNLEHMDLSQDDARSYRVCVISAADLAADWGQITSPNLKTADGQRVDGLLSGCNCYTFNGQSDFQAFMRAVSGAPWVAQNIISIYTFPPTVMTAGAPVTIGGVQAYFMGDTPDQSAIYTTNDIYTKLMRGTPTNYRHLKKFATFPYSCVELTTYEGTPVILKPEMFGGNTLALNLLSCGLAPFAKIAMYPDDYGKAVEGGTDIINYRYSNFAASNQAGQIKRGNFLDVAVWITEFPQFSIVNNNYINYLASNNSKLSASYQAAGWSNSKANAGALLAYDQSTRSIDTAQANKDIQNVADAITGVMGAVGGLASGGIAGGVSSALGTGVGLVSSNMQFQNNQGLASMVRDTNQQYADFANSGDLENATRQIDAAVQDAALTPPSVIGQTSGGTAGYNYSNGLLGVSIRFKMINQNAVRVIGNYFMRYGYAIHEYLQPPADLRCMTRFTYWKMVEVYLESTAVQEGYKDTIRGMLMRGCTVWSNPADIGNINLTDNEALGGISY